MYMLRSWIALSPLFVACTTARNIFDLHVDHPMSQILGLQEDGTIRNVAERGVEGRCGPGYGKCAPETCCSTAGYCGKTQDYCRSPDCQIDFGHCDAHTTPGGPSTDVISRPKNGRLPYGPEAIRSCKVPGTVALTYDDGPNQYTSDLLDLLDAYKAKATFFVTGNNNAKGQIDSPGLPWVSLIQRMHNSGHQIASHTWSHQDLSKITQTQRRVQLLWNEVALRNILGAFPAYMRPPYSSCTAESGCLEDMGSMGYHIILYDIDTEDYRHDDPSTIQISKDIFDNNLARGKASDKSWLVIAHDVHEQTVHNLTHHMLSKLKHEGYRAVTVGECLGDPQEFWYRRDDNFQKNMFMSLEPDLSPAQTVSLDGHCGKNITCIGSTFGDCCSATNRCGNSSKHCEAGCQQNAGHCHTDDTRTIVMPPLLSRPHRHTPLKSGASSLKAGSNAAGLLLLLVSIFL